MAAFGASRPLPVRPGERPVSQSNSGHSALMIERTFADLVPTDPEARATVKQVNDEIGIQWLFSFLSTDKRKTYCLYEAPSAEAIRAAAKRLGVPADTIVEVGQELGPYAAMLAPLRKTADAVSPT
jgi:hypothetical protein